MGFIQPLVASWEKRIYRSPLLSNLYGLPYHQVIKKEVDLANITAQDIILNIGCGAVPFTAIYLATLSGAKVWAVDRDREAVAKARVCLKKLNLQDRINVIKREGNENIEVHFTAAVVALQAEPKSNILTNLLTSSPSGARLIFREARKLLQSQYDYLPKEFHFVKQITHYAQTFNSVLFVKQHGGSTSLPVNH